MTTYTFIGKAGTEFVNWDDPTVWANGAVPNSPSADVVFPGNAASGTVTIAAGESFTAASVNGGTILALDGNLSVVNNLTLTAGEIDLQGSLSAQTLTLQSGSVDIQGAGVISIAGAVVNDAGILGDGAGSLTLNASQLTNNGTLSDLTVNVSSGGFTNLSGSTLTGGTYDGYGSALFLNVGGMIVTDATHVDLEQGGNIETYDSGSGQYVSIESTLSRIAHTGTLFLANQTYNWGALTDNGTLTLVNATLDTPQLIVGAGGTVSGIGTIDAPIANNGTIVAGIDSLSLAYPPPPSDLLKIDGTVSGRGVLEVGLPYAQPFGPVVTYTYPTLELQGPVSENVVFLSRVDSQGQEGGTLILDHAAEFTGAISPGLGGDIIVLGVDYGAVTGYSYSGSSAGGTLTIDEAGTTITLNFIGDMRRADFSLSAGPQAISGSPTSLEISFTASENPRPPANTTADVIMHDAANGEYQTFNIGDNAVVGAYSLGQLIGNWRVAGVGGFEGAGTTDLLLHNPLNGTLGIADIVHNHLGGATSIGQFGSAWQVAGLGDFSSNSGETDILLRNANTGVFQVLDINHDTITASSDIGHDGLQWSVAGVGDFSSNPDETDMMMRNTTTGAFKIIDISNNSIVGQSHIGQVGLEWSVAGFGDFSGNPNETDMLLRNTATGAFEVYDISNNTITASSHVAHVGLNWKVVGFGDFSGNPDETDMMMRNTTTGALKILDISNNAVTGNAPIGQVGFEWKISGTADHPPAASEAPARPSVSIGGVGNDRFIFQASAGTGTGPADSTTHADLSGLVHDNTAEIAQLIGHDAMGSAPVEHGHHEANSLSPWHAYLHDAVHLR